MNRSMIVFILGWILKIEAAFLLIPFLVGLTYREGTAWIFLGTAGGAYMLGFLMTLRRPANMVFYRREGCIATGLGWVLMSLVGALPFTISGEIPSYVDALFETISGFTTTGASILSDVEALSHCMLYWRSLTHWLGGMGVLVFLLAVIQMSGGSNMNLMKAESPGPSVGKIVPKAMTTARILYFIYIFMTAAQILLLLLGGMSFFEASCTAFGTAGTGGFGVKNDSLGGYSAYIQWVTTVFMILFGVNFNVYSLLLFKKVKQALRIEELRWYLLIIAGAIAIIMVNAYDASLGFSGNLRQVSFQVASIITTTGFSTTDFDLWPMASKTVLVILMFIGACAGSTGGGIKVSRIILGVKDMVRELNSYLYPKSVKRIKMDGRSVDDDTLRSVQVYYVIFLLLFVVSVLLVSLENKDLTTNFTAVAATINNIGPGLSLVGPTANFGHFDVLSKVVLMFDMLAGRLELFPLLLLLYPPTWKGMLGLEKNRTDRIL